MNREAIVQGWATPFKRLVLGALILAGVSCAEESNRESIADRQEGVVVDTAKSIALYYPESEDAYLLMNLRAGAGEAYPRVGAIKPGDSVRIVGLSIDSVWLLTSTGGWVVTRNVRTNCIPRLDISNLPVLEEVKSRDLVVVDDKIEALDSLFTLMADDGMFNGCVIAAANGQIVMQKTLGYANFRTHRRLEPTTAFELASDSKQFTAMAIMILKESGKLDYDDKITKFFPDFPAYGKEITIRHLLNHTSGLVCYINEYMLPEDERRVTNPMSILREQEGLHFEPGEKYRYCNTGYWLLGRIVEKVSGLDYASFMREKIFEPLAMNHSYAIGDPRLPEADVASCIVPDECSETDPRTGSGYTYSETGPYGVLSCVVDLFTYDQALYDEKLVSKETLKEAFTPPILPNGNKSKYGFGWNIAKSPGGIRISHGGLKDGYQSWFERHPETGSTLIILSNYYVLNGFEGLIDGVDDIFTFGHFRMPVGLISNKLFRMVMDDGTDNLQRRYDSLRVRRSGDFVFSEPLLVHAARLFLERDCLGEALAVANVSVKEYPGSAAAYWVLGAAYRKLDNKEKAIACLKKSLQFDQGYEPSSSLLKSLEE